MTKRVALLRGINVGTAKSVPMPVLAKVFTELGFTEVSTVLRSGNVVFEQDAVGVDDDAPARIERAVLEATGVQSRVIVLDDTAFRQIAEANPYTAIARDVASGGSRLFTTFLEAPAPHGIELPPAESLAPELLTVSTDAIYQWMPDGSMQTKVPKSFWKQFSSTVTARNENTVQKLIALLD